MFSEEPPAPSSSYAGHNPMQANFLQRKAVPGTVGEIDPASGTLPPGELDNEAHVDGYNISPASSIHQDTSPVPASGPSPLIPWRQPAEEMPMVAPRWPPGERMDHLGSTEDWATQQQQQTYQQPTDQDEILLAPYHGQQHWPEEGKQDGTNPAGSGPFMHYEDFAHFDPNKETAVPASRRLDDAETFSLEDLKRSRMPWKRKKRRKQGPLHPGKQSEQHKGAIRSGVTDWTPEILWFLLSILNLAAVTAVLKIYDGRPLSDWPLAISLNTLVAFLTALCQVAFVAPVLEGLAQLKWNWFTRADRSLTDLQLFDDAGCSPVGAARLLVTARGRPLGILASLLLLTALVTSPLTQLAIAHPTRLSPAANGTASVPLITSYSSPSISLTPHGGPSSDQKRAIQSALFTPANETIAFLAPTCSTGDCYFRSFTSLSVCLATDDVTSQLTVTSRSASLPNGALLTGDPDAAILNIATRTTVSYDNDPNLVSTSIADIFIIYTNRTTSSFRALEILLHFCVNSYIANVTDGIASISQTTSTTRILSNTTDELVLGGPEAHDTKNYTIDAVLAKALNSYMVDVFVGSYGSKTGGTVASEMLGDALYQEDSDEERNTLGGVFQNVAVGLTNSIRQKGTTQPGVALAYDTFVSVRWGWLAFLACQVVLSTVFVFCVAVQTSVWSVAVVKSHTLATLLAVGSEDRAVLERHYGLQGYSKDSVRSKVGGLTGRFRVLSGGKEWVMTLGDRHRDGRDAREGDEG